MKSAIWLMLVCMVCGQLEAQQITQTVRGRVIDTDAKFPLLGVSVRIVGDDPEKVIGTTTDQDGIFRLNNVPVGRLSLRISYIGYKEVLLSNLILTSGKELILEVPMEEQAFELSSVVITASKTGEVQNEMALISARAFSVDETDRYAGSRGDPARMASNFAGVQGADDSRNDIVIRGNSPGSVLWQVEGVNIPNPNHFNIAGTAGGPVSIINNKMLGNSDFYTGAFPAEFGNTVSGVFDLKLRNGNNEKYEYSAQFGFLGTELFAEGPFSKGGKSSFLFTYRYSTLSLFNGLGIDVGTTAIPKYQDASFRLNFPLKNNANLSFFGIGGDSQIDIEISKENIKDRNLYGENDRDQYFGSRMGVFGATYTKILKNQSFLKATLAASGDKVYAHHYFIIGKVKPDGFLDIEELPQILGYDFSQNKYSQVFSIYKKMDARNTIQYGFVNDLYQFNFADSARQVRSVFNPTLGKREVAIADWLTRWDTQSEFAYLAQPYFQWRRKWTEKLAMVAGVHAQYFSLSNSLSDFEPRISFNYQLANNQS
jgi:ethanolamine utilization microcompartment shell protein EutS